MGEGGHQLTLGGGSASCSRRHQAEPEEEGVCPEGGEGLG